jgi:site-specific recombinase XerD
MTSQKAKVILSVCPTDFIRERKYLHNVSPASIVWYEQAFKRFDGAIESREAVIMRISELRERGLSPVSVNVHLRVLNAYFRWLNLEHQQPLIHISRLKEEQKILATFSPDQIHRLVHWKPVKRNETRAHTIALVALDTGMRISELLGLTRQDVDFDNLVLQVHGKGNKQRLVPMSIGLRKVLYRHLAKHQYPRVFCTRTGTAPSVRNSERDFQVVCRKAGISGVRCSWHTLRHSFSVNYLRAGGNLYYLKRILGHSCISTTERYLRSLGIEDLQRVHDGLSLLSR